ncbi:unnamed protein product [Rhizoctonia solani]|uniref:F-box domain-containing protein n=1 Tax=Rhizoctonia solani TaxID=456999 RepID=A0A8H3E7U8_9AGAM|nr:unnamed protein product [Rhizoctonia solani]
MKSFGMAPTLLGLPQEIIVYILAWTLPQDLLKWRQACRLLKQFIDGSAELQYLIELYSFGYVPPSNPRHDILYPEKLRLVKEHQRQWKTTSWTQVDMYPLKKRNSSSVSSTYDFCGGIYAQGFSLPGIGEHTRRLDLYQLPSVNRGTPWKQWSIEDLGVDVRDFVMQPDYDLLVLLEINKSLPRSNPDGIEGAPDLTQYFTIHLRTLGTNQPHPDAARPTISYSTPSYRRTRPSFYFQIVGRYLAVQFLISSVSSEKFQLRVWDWTTGKDVTYIEPWRAGAESFTFLSDRLVLIPCLQVVSENEDGLHDPRTHGKLIVFTFTDPMGDQPAREARPIASFDLPNAANPFLDLQGLSCRCDPAPVPSFRSATRHDGIPKLFDLAPENRVLCLKMRSQAVIPVDQVESTLYIQFADLVRAVSHLLDEPADKPMLNIPWKDWAKGTSWVDTDLLFTGNECYVFGQRVVSVGLDRSEMDSEMEEIDTLIRRFSSLCVFDFDPIRVKRAELSSESGVEIFDPKKDSILGVWGEGPSLRSTFVEGEHAADAPFTLRKTLINERLGHHYYVMVDEEHVVMVLQRFGRESSLIVYSFS